jgi:ribosomal protein S18 acetylase RimI-like enzyme
MNIVKANGNQYDAVRSFYHSLIDGMQSSPYDIGWKKDVYPSPEFLQDSIHHGELFVGLENNQIVAAMVLKHQCNDGYKEFHWQTQATKEEVTVIHALGVHPSQSGKGYAKAMVRKAFEFAAAHHQKALRLDVLSGNVPAEKLYRKMGFQYMDTLQMYYEDTGWTNYELYEYVL